MRVIGFGAHPDDVEIFFFGTLCASAALGNEIGWVVATDGAASGGVSPDELRKLRRAEAERAASLVSVQPIFLELPDGALGADDRAFDRVRRAVEVAAPDLILTHAPNCYHRDHRALSRLVKEAASFQVPVVYADTLMGVGFAPTIYVDITAHFPTKLRAISEHRSQQPDRFVSACELWNGFRALQCTGNTNGFAEAFLFEPTHPFADVRGLLPPAPGQRR